MAPRSRGDDAGDRPAGRRRLAPGADARRRRHHPPGALRGRRSRPLQPL